MRQVLARGWVVTGAAVALVLCLAERATAEEPAKKPEEKQTTAEAKPAESEFKPPPGYRRKKRGDAVIYCRKEKPLGSRFPEEKCYDEAQLRELALRPPWSDTVKACGTSGCTTP